VPQIKHVAVNVLHYNRPIMAVNVLHYNRPIMAVNILHYNRPIMAVNVLHYNRQIFTAVNTCGTFSYIFLVSHISRRT